LFNNINNESSDIEKMWIYQKIHAKYIELCGENGKSWKIQELQDMYEYTIQDDDSYKNQFDTFFQEFEERKWKLQELELSIFWKDLGTENELPWLEKRINSLYSENERKYKDFYDKINKELTAWTTSVNLAKVFEGRVSVYSRERVVWTWLFIIGVVAMIVYLLYSFEEESNWIIVSLNFLQHLPAFLLVWWLWFFISSRQAESRKLEEAYRHKATMARAYFWYKDTIEELDVESDWELAKKHMENLLDAMKEDSSKFLSHNWEKHPLYDAFMKFLDKSGWKISLKDFSYETK
jgi:hypothetical protein